MSRYEEAARALAACQPDRTSVCRQRLVLNGILWVLRTGAPWRDAPTEYGPWQTLSTRFYRWVKTGLWDQILAALQQQAEADVRHREKEVQQANVCWLGPPVAAARATARSSM